MSTLIVFGAGHNGSVREAEVIDNTARVVRGDLVTHRDAQAAPGTKAATVNYDEEFSVREFHASNGKSYLIAEHQVSVPDTEVQKRIDILISFKSLS
ncbi:hypothetical protein RA241_003710 [Cronobacter sakazakii]|nr:hypothetical protein [Cronobacter sakazakii]